MHIFLHIVPATFHKPGIGLSESFNKFFWKIYKGVAVRSIRILENKDLILQISWTYEKSKVCLAALFPRNLFRSCWVSNRTVAVFRNDTIGENLSHKQLCTNYHDVLVSRGVVRTRTEMRIYLLCVWGGGGRGWVHDYKRYVISLRTWEIGKSGRVMISIAFFFFFVIQTRRSLTLFPLTIHLVIIAF